MYEYRKRKKRADREGVGSLKLNMSVLAIESVIGTPKVLKLPCVVQTEIYLHLVISDAK